MGSWNGKRPQRPLVQTLLPTSPIRRPLEASSPFPCSHTFIARNSPPHVREQPAKNLCELELSGHCSLAWGAGLRAEVASAGGLREGAPDQPFWPSFLPAPTVGWSSFQAAWSPAPAHRMILTLSVTPAPMWSTSHPATRAAQTGWSKRLWTKAR